MGLLEGLFGGQYVYQPRGFDGLTEGARRNKKTFRDRGANRHPNGKPRRRNPDGTFQRSE